MERQDTDSGARLVVLLLAAVLVLAGCQMGGTCVNTQGDNSMHGNCRDKDGNPDGDAGNSSEEPQPVASGVIGGLKFTVLGGTAFQDAPNEPLSAGSDGARILFDDAISSLSTTPDAAWIQVTANFEDGGRVMVAAFGQAGNDLTGSLVAGFVRTGSDFIYEFLHGLGGTLDASGAVSPVPSSPDSSLHVTADITNLAGGTAATLWHPEIAGPSGDPCPAGQVYSGLLSAPNGDGDRFGLDFRKGQVTQVDVTSSLSPHC